MTQRLICPELDRSPNALVRRVLGGFLVASLLACGGSDAGPTLPSPPTPPSVPDIPTGPFAVGTAYTDEKGWIQYTAGDAPLVLIAPHGGLLSPSALPDRDCSGCVTGNDLNTQELARAIADTFATRTGRRPHLIANLLHRRKFDGNRELTEATDGNTAALGASWNWMHGAVDTARNDVVRRWSRGLVLDLHGHAHAIARLELGYLLTATQLRLDNAALTASGALSSSSISRLIAEARSGRAPAEMLRGANSLGGLLQARGYDAVPSPAAPAPLVGEEYFNGGYNTSRHGSRTGSTIDAIQVECHFAGVRDTPASRAAFASALVDALLVLLDEEYDWRPAS